MRFLILISCLFLITTPIYAAQNPCNEHQCIGVIDAGSTGSRLHIFAYDLDQTKTPINITEVWAKKNSPGFATINTNQETINAYMTVLFAGAPAQNLPVYFYATAGMRLVPQTKQKIYYQNLKNWFSQQAEWRLIDAKTITGDDEALYDWLSVNYHTGALKAEKPVGVIDIGGASTQISFPIQPGQDLGTNDKNARHELDIYGQHITLFTHSFLGLGQNEMAHQLLNSTSCFAMNYPLPDGGYGQGSAPDCELEITTLINGVHKANSLVQPILANNPVNSWYAIGGIANIAESKPFHFDNAQLTNQEFMQQANHLVCHQQWDELSTQYPGNEYLDTYCMLPAYYYSLMVDGYGFSPGQVINYVPPAKNLDWTLGVVLHH